MTTDPIRALFIHHSVGRYLIRDGSLRRRLSRRPPGGAPIALWDHDYNRRGLCDGSGRPLGRSFPLPDDDTDPPALLNLFGGGGSAAEAARRQALEFEVVAMKSCYPNSAIGSDAELARDEDVYRRLLAALAELPHNEFLLLTSPPLISLRTNREQSQRARQLSSWLAHDAELPANVAVFDLFDRLATPAAAGAHGNRLRRRYRRRLPVDAHPNVRAGEEVGPELVKAIARAAARARGGVSAGG